MVTRAELEASISQLKREVLDGVQEFVRDAQTEILKAFLPHQQQVQVQFREIAANTGNSVQSVKMRMDILERRLGEIEKRLLMHPPGPKPAEQTATLAGR